jgi:hypothetical protein
VVGKVVVVVGGVDDVVLVVVVLVFVVVVEVGVVVDGAIVVEDLDEHEQEACVTMVNTIINPIARQQPINRNWFRFIVIFPLLLAKYS